ncbi:MAG: putative metal-binding motif-containing protein [Myxococcota bacterium]
MKKRSWALLSLALGCSVIIDPDGSKLGGDVDAGLDAARLDAAQLDAARLDASRDASPDALADAGLDATDAGPCPRGCDDGVECTRDECTAAGCSFTPVPGVCDSDEICDPVRDCVEDGCRSDGECSDGNLCNGMERCDRGRGLCVPGVAVVCDDGVACTDDVCDPDTGACSSEMNDDRCDDGLDCTQERCLRTGCEIIPQDGRCRDGVACTSDRCEIGRGCVNAPNDSLCDDRDACTTDSCEADGCVSEFEDEDDDGFPAPSPPGCRLKEDCNDGDGEVYPGAPERCNDRDDNCDGAGDECRPGDSHSCSACDGAYRGVQRCGDLMCGFEACGEFEVPVIEVDPGGPDYRHDCGFRCDPLDWCHITSTGPACALISDGPGLALPPGAYEAEFFWGDRGTWTFSVFVDGDAAASRTETNSGGGSFPRTIVPFRIDGTCGLVDVRVFGGRRIRLFDTIFRRVGE